MNRRHTPSGNRRAQRCGFRCSLRFFEHRRSFDLLGGRSSGSGFDSANRRGRTRFRNRRFFDGRLFHGDRRAAIAFRTSSGRNSSHGNTLPYQLRNGFIDRTGVGLLFRDAELWKHLEYFVRGNLKLPCQLINPNLTHKYCITLKKRRLADLLRVLYSIRLSFGVWGFRSHRALGLFFRNNGPLCVFGCGERTGRRVRLLERRVV